MVRRVISKFERVRVGQHLGDLDERNTEDQALLRSLPEQLSTYVSLIRVGMLA